MSGSLNLLSSGGQWSAQCAPGCPLMIGQTKATISGWIAPSSPANAGVQNFFALTGRPSGGFQNQLSNSNHTLVFALVGLTSQLTYNYTVPFNGQWIHFAQVLDGTGTSTIYIDGQSKATKANIGGTSSSPNQVKIGIDQSQAANFLIADFAIANGIACTAAQVIQLRDKSATPESLGFTSHWSLSGTVGNNPVASAEGLLDLIGTNHFTIVPGSGNSLTTAVYSSSAPIWVPAITIPTVQVTRSGNILRVFTGTNPALGPVQPAYPASIFANPVFKRNGVPMSVVGPIWESVRRSIAHADWWPYTPGSPPTPITIAPTDVITWEAPGNWVQASQGIAGGESGTAVNCSGGYEPGVFGYPGEDPASSTPTLKFGYNGQSFPTSLSNIMANIMPRCGNPWSGATSSTPDGFPLTVASGSSCTSTVWDSAVGNGIDGKGEPVPLGTITLIGDEFSPATPITPTISSQSGQTGWLTQQLTLADPGTSSGGHLLNRKWTGTIGLATSASYNLKLQLTLEAQAGQTSQSLNNLRMFIGNDPADNAPGMKGSQGYLALITAAPGVYSPLIRFLIDGDGAGSTCRASDLRSTSDFSYTTFQPFPAANIWPTSNPTLTKSRMIPVRRVQPYDVVNGSKNVYTAQQYLRTVPSDISYLDYAFMWRIAALGLDYDWMYPNRTNGDCVIEFVCEDAAGNPVNHNLQAGQQITPTVQFTVNVATANGPGVTTIKTNPMLVWPTSPSKFVQLFPSTAPPASRAGNTNGVQVVNQTFKFSMTVGDTGHDFPPEAFCGLPAMTGGQTGLMVSLNHALNDAAVTRWAQAIYNNTPRGTRIYPQCSNEALIPAIQYGFFNYLASLEGFGISNGKATIQRTYEMQKIFTDIWGADAGSINRHFQVWTANPSYTQEAFGYAHAQSFPFDSYSLAPYMDPDVDSPSLLLACASIAANDPRSIAHPSNGGTGIPLPMAGFHDIHRGVIRYTTTFNGPTGFPAQHANAIAASGYGQGGGPSGFRFPFPKCIGYEGNYDTPISAGVSHITKVLRAGLLHDFLYHRGMYDTAMTYCRTLNQFGPAGSVGLDAVTISTLCLGRWGPSLRSYTCPDGPDNQGVLNFTSYMYQGQRAGRGLSNKFWLDDGIVHDVDNEQPSARAQLDFIAQVAGAPPPPASFIVTPNSIATGASNISLTLSGTSTTWTGGSTVTIQNSITGTTTVTKGTFAAITPTLGILVVSAGAGLGTWTITVDGVVSPTLTVASGPPPVASFTVTPTNISPNNVVLLTLVGTNTTWSGASNVFVDNTISGTEVTGGAFTPISATLATLSINAGPIPGQWNLHVDGIASQVLTVSARRRTWFGQLVHRR